MSVFVLFTTGAVATGRPLQMCAWPRQYQATVVGTGAVSATVNFYGSNNQVDWELIGTASLSGTDRAHSGSTSAANWDYVMADVTAISAASVVTATMGA